MVRNTDDALSKQLLRGQYVALQQLPVEQGSGRILKALWQVPMERSSSSENQ